MSLTDLFETVAKQFAQAMNDLDSLVGDLERVEGLELSAEEALAAREFVDDLGTIFAPAELAERLRSVVGGALA
jgi:hypothetical protein